MMGYVGIGVHPEPCEIYFLCFLFGVKSSGVRFWVNHLGAACLP